MGMCDLKNEPHGQAAWHSNNPIYDWDTAAVKCGNAILVTPPPPSPRGSCQQPHWQRILRFYSS